MNRLRGLDLARYLAFVGMVILNFKIAMGAQGDSGFAALIGHLLEGRAAATFVVLAGIGLGLAAARSDYGATLRVILRRAAFLLVIGLLNSLIFDADILHYYAFYFLFGALLIGLSTRQLIGSIIGLNVVFVVMILSLNYDAGWDWSALTYANFWTPVGFIRNLFFNGWHPIIPWLAFLLVGIVLARLDLGARKIQIQLIAWGAGAVALAEGLSLVLQPVMAAIDPELAVLVLTAPVPPMPLYMLAGTGVALVVTGLCLRGADRLEAVGVLGFVTPAGRQTLTLYIAHILIGMGTLEAMGRLGGQTAGQALAAALVFCLSATVYAWIWARVFKRGPIEAVMRKLAG